MSQDQQPSSPTPRSSRPVSLLAGLAAWLLAWAALLRALDTGSMWAYLAVIVLLIYGLNRVVRAVRG